MLGDVHSVLLGQNLVVTDALGHQLLYGTSDPGVNLGEYILTILMAKKLGTTATFLVYEQGPQEFVNLSLAASQLVAKRRPDWQNLVCSWLGAQAQIRGLVETVLRPTGLWNQPVGEIVAEMKGLRPKSQMVAFRRPDFLHYSDSKSLLNSKSSLGDWHESGAWMGGSMIHYCLRKYSEQVSTFTHLAPWNEKGRVYEIYSGAPISFILTPWLGIVPLGAQRKWGLSFHPECFGSLLKEVWREETRQQALALLEEALFSGIKSRKVLLEAGVGGFGQ